MSHKREWTLVPHVPSRCEECERKKRSRDGGMWYTSVDFRKPIVARSRLSRWERERREGREKSGATGSRQIETMAWVSGISFRLSHWLFALPSRESIGSVTFSFPKERLIVDQGEREEGDCDTPRTFYHVNVRKWSGQTNGLQLMSRYFAQSVERES